MVSSPPLLRRKTGAAPCPTAWPSTSALVYSFGDVRILLGKLTSTPLHYSLVGEYLNHVQEAHPIFTPSALKAMVIDLVDSSAEVRKTRQIGMAQLLLIMANGVRFSSDVESAVGEAMGEFSATRAVRRG